MVPGSAGTRLAEVDPQSFRRACSKYATGITVVTVCAPGGDPQGITVNSFTSVSLEPPLILVCIELKSTVLPHLRATPYFAVNILTEEQRPLSVQFSQVRDDRFAGIPWSASEHGAPLLENTLGAMECRAVGTIPAGDHVILLGEVTGLAWNEGRPLLYFNSGYQTLA